MSNLISMTLANGKTYDVCANDTIFYPALNMNLRNSLVVHMPITSMSLSEFVALMSDEKNTATIRITRSESTIQEFQKYTICASVGQSRFDSIDPTTGVVTSEDHYVAKLEQLTFTEQKLADLGVL